MSQAAQPVFQVSELVTEMQRLMEASYPQIWIEGELSSLSTPASGHLYFTLKDDKSQLRCAMFRSRASVNKYKLKAGDLVRVRAKISVYAARGDLQCIVQYVEEAGEGLLLRQFEELKNKLQLAGLFAVEHKLALPRIPHHIGIITSPTGAAVKDIISTLARRCPGIPITIYPAVVQGDGAAKSLISALADAVAHNRCDVLILTRGGGSLEDLWCFNDEQLAHAIYNCPVPLIAGVGHEVDVTIADYVADLRAPTPTAAAEILSPDNIMLQQQLRSLGKRLLSGFNRLNNSFAQRVDFKFQQLHHPRAKIKLNRQQLTAGHKRLEQAMASQIRHAKLDMQQITSRFNAQPPKKVFNSNSSALRALAKRLQRTKLTSIKSKQQRFTSLGSQLHLVSPLATLDRGFSIARDQNNTIIRDTQNTNTGDSLQIQFKSGKVLAEIKEVVE